MVVHPGVFVTGTELQTEARLQILHQGVSGVIHVFLKLVNPQQKCLQVALHSLVKQVARYTLQLHCVVALYLPECGHLLGCTSKQLF